VKKYLRFLVLILIFTVACLLPAACSTKNTIEELPQETEEQPENVVIEGLPQMRINLFDKKGVFALSDVTREKYVDSTISIENTKEENLLDTVAAKFKGRGNGSWTNDKKGYRIKFKNNETTVFGKTNKHWVLLPDDSWSEKSTMYRNYLALNLARNVFDKIEYCTSATFIDLYVNEEYQGVYVLCEHVRVSEDRVNIDSKYGEPETGYLIEYDAYADGVEGIDFFKIDGVKYPFTVHSPDPEEYEDAGITKEVYQEQVNHIQDYVERAYNAALSKDYDTFAALVDVDSFVDMYILHELFKNVDTGWSSFYLYKKPSGKLFAGPAWDFDLSCMDARGNNSPTGIYVADEVRTDSDFTASELYIQLYQTPEFLQKVKERWAILSDSISAFIDEQMNEEIYEQLKNSMGENFARWEENLTVEEAEVRWVNNMRKTKAWFAARIAWLDYEWFVIKD